MKFDLLLTLGGYVGSVIGSFLFVKAKVTKMMNVAIKGENNTQMLPASEKKEKAKIFENKPLINNNYNQATSNTTNNTNNQNYNRLPDMRGIENSMNGMESSDSGQLGDFFENKSTGMTSNNSGSNSGASAIQMACGGGGANIVVGLVNGVLVGPQSGNVNNMFRSEKRQIIGPMMQTGIVGNYKLKGTRSISQIGNSILNQTRFSRLTMNQKAGDFKSLVRGSNARFNVKQLSNNYIDGDIKGLIRAPRGRIYGNIRKGVRAAGASFYTGQIKGVSRVGSLMAQNYISTKGTKVKIKQIVDSRSNGTNGLQLPQARYTLSKNSNRMYQNQTPRIAMTINDANLQRITRYSLDKNVYHIDANRQLLGGNSSDMSKQYANPVELKQTFADPKNANLNSQQKVRLYALTKIQERDVVLGKDSNISQERTKRNYEEIFRKIIQSDPNLSLSTKEMMAVAKRAQQLHQEMALSRDTAARARANFASTSNRQDMTALNNILKSSAGIQSRLNSWIDSNFNSDIYNFTKEEMEQIEEQARKNVEANEAIPLEKKEEEYKKEVKKLQGEKQEENKQEVEEYVKEQILDDPDGYIAQEILGEEGQKQLKEENIKDNRRREDKYNEYRERQEKTADEQFRSKHKEYKDSKTYVVREARVDDEWRQHIKEAVEELNAKPTNEGNNNAGMLMEENTTMQSGEMEDEQGQVTTNPNVRIFIPRDVQEREREKVEKDGNKAV